ncbi:Hsp20/alpha crystallin family protein [Candidatus Riflebacteria bacterium]
MTKEFGLEKQEKGHEIKQGRVKETEKFLSPFVDIYEDEEKIVLLADMPGVSKENLSIDIEENHMTIVGDISAENTSAKVLYTETPVRGYKRVFGLGREIDQANIKANLENGVLVVFLNKAEAAKPRKIEIK